jgi:hypothetical protein
VKLLGHQVAACKHHQRWQGVFQYFKYFHYGFDVVFFVYCFFRAKINNYLSIYGNKFLQKIFFVAWANIFVIFFLQVGLLV